MLWGVVLELCRSNATAAVPAGEKAEMVELLEDKGFETPDAIRFIDLISKNREFFVNFMVRV